MALTALQIKNAKEGMHPDGNGLYLRVQKSGAKSWIFRFQINKRRREMGIGTLADLPAPAARIEAARLAGLVRSGIDPIEERNSKAAKAAEAYQHASARATTFRQVASAYIESHRASWRNEKHVQQWENTLETYAGPVIGDLPVGEVTTEHILEILKPLWKTKTETASRLRGRIEQVLSYAKVLKLRSGENPALWRGHLDALLPAPNRIKQLEHHPALPYAMAPDFLAELRTVSGFGARALEFLLLTAVRSEEVRAATWSEIDLDEKLWRIPRARQKVKDARLDDHFVPLSSAAIHLLETLPKIEGEPLIFPGMRKGRPLSDMTLGAVIRRANDQSRKAGNTPRWVDPKSDRDATPHGFRSTFRDWAAEVGGYSRDLAEHALAHGLPDKVEAAYQRGTMIERRRPMMQAWADYLEKRPQAVSNEPKKKARRRQTEPLPS